MSYDLLIIGAGVTGLIALGMLPPAAAAWSICVVDPSFSTGDLSTKWGPVRSNTTAKQIRDALRAVPGFTVTCGLAIDKYSDAEYVPLHVIASDVQRVATAALSRTECIIDHVVSLTATEDKWQAAFRHRHAPIIAKRVFLCTGGEPRAFDIAKPTIPLEVAFDQARLARHVTAGDTITVFGAAHSGVLVAHNLCTAGARVFLVHRRPLGQPPFSYARDGAYEGVKGDAAAICDDILLGKYGSALTLVSYSDGAAVANATIRSRAIVYAVGFVPRKGVLIAGDENRGYNPQTGTIDGVSGVWGFGMGFPNSTEYEGRTYYDVGIPSFVEHIRKCFATATAAASF